MIDAETKQYWKDLYTQRVLGKLSGPERRLSSTMQSVILQLQLKKLWPVTPRTLELFGMHGLWHTMDYVDLVGQLDFFEINKKYLDLARKNLSSYPVTFHNEDSIAWLKGTASNYDLVVADIPYSGPFYDEQGLPLFMKDLIKATGPNGVLIFNCHASMLEHFVELETLIKHTIGPRGIKDLFFAPRNSKVMYVVVALS